MNKVTVPPAVKSQPLGLDADLEFCDESGRTLGYFVPASADARALYDWARSEFTDEEVESALDEPGGRTTAEVLARLGLR